MRRGLIKILITCCRNENYILDKNNVYQSLQDEEIMFPVNLRILLALNHLLIYKEIFNCFIKCDIKI